MTKQTILFVDDSADIRTVMSIGLEHFGYQIVTASDAETTMAAIEKHQPDLVIMDNGLPGIEGVELGAQILQQAKYASLPIVLFTGTRNRELEDRAKSIGFVDCWIKPIGLNSIGKKIESLLNSSGDSER